MAQSTWLESRKKRTRLYYIVIILVLAVCVVFFYNNREVFFTHFEKKSIGMAGARKARVALAADRPAENALHALENQPGGQAVEKVSVPKPAAGPQHAAIAVENATDRQTVSLSDIRCAVRGREDVVVVVSLELVVGREQLKKETLLKREDLKTMVRKVIAGKTMDELIIDSLRQQTKTSMDRILENGALNDVLFRTFRIEKVK